MLVLNKSLQFLTTRKFLTALFKGIWIYWTLSWFYTSLYIFYNPAYQFANLSIYIPIPINAVADSSFVIAFVAFVIWEYLRKSQP